MQTDDVKGAHCGVIDPYIGEPCEREEGHTGLHKNEYEEWFYPHHTLEEARRKLASDLAAREARRVR